MNHCGIFYYDNDPIVNTDMVHCHQVKYGESQFNSITDLLLEVNNIFQFLNCV